MDAHGVDRLFLFQIHDDPLGMQRVAFASELAGEIRIALPIERFGP